jgi:translation initiation factor IF-3
MEVTGRIKKIFEEQSFASGFRKKEIVVTTAEQYPQDILIEFTQDKIDLLNSFSLGDEVKVSINLRGREWINPEGVAKYFNSVSGWRIERMGAAEQPPMSSQPPIETTADYGAASESDAKDDLPF